ncbi:MAG: DUF4250 domain-containing protein [Lachnospiraceae bacterium]|nr:DUF4250 domain-containing protein [Lachnospiraceae bacterium]MCD8131800.1 DUF4250 domain-containing protein [Lachnospiraceae bacterium]
MLPRDPMILMSFINLKLRDYYPTLEDLCEDLGVSVEDVMGPLTKAGFTYDEERRRFF